VGANGRSLPLPVWRFAADAVSKYKIPEKISEIQDPRNTRSQRKKIQDPRENDVDFRCNLGWGGRGQCNGSVDRVSPRMVTLDGVSPRIVGQGQSSHRNIFR
jgi:hypothetical protein